MARIGRTLAAVLVVCALAPGLPGQRGKLYPRDDSVKSPSFAEFKKRLLGAVESKDADHLISVLDAAIRCDFSDCHGVPGFVKAWNPSDPDSEIWAELQQILTLGVVLSNDPESGYYSAPYVFRAFPDEFDPFDYGAVVRDEAPVRARPDADSEVLFRLSYDIVKMVEWLPDPARPGCQACGWHRVETLDGRSGYMSRTDARSPIDYRATFEKVDGRWRLTSFLAGD